MKAEEIKVLNVDGVPYVVDNMSQTVQGLVSVFNGWSQQEVDAREKLMMIQAAKNDLSRQIIAQIRKDLEEEQKAADAEAAKTESPAEPEISESNE